MAAIMTKMYQTLFRRTSTFALTILVGAFFFERAVDVGCDYIFDKINEGVSKSEVFLNFYSKISFRGLTLIYFLL